MAAPGILYFHPEADWARHTAFRTQVLDQISFMESLGYQCSLLVGYQRGEHDSARYLEDHLSGSLYLTERPLSGHFVNVYRHARSSFNRFRQQFKQMKNFAVYYRNFITFSATRGAFHRIEVPTVFDFRGVPMSEAAFRRGRNPWYLPYLDRLYGEIGFRADRTLCVSQAMADWLESKTGKRVTGIVPSCGDKERFFVDFQKRGEARKKLGWSEDDVVFFFAGAAWKWQRINDLLRFFKHLERQHPRCRLLALISEDAAAQSIRDQLRSLGISENRYAVFSSLPDDVPFWLNAADYGVIFRHDHLVNRVASPIKLAEYLLTGLPVIASPHIGDVSDLIERYELGVIVTESAIQQSFDGIEFNVVPTSISERRRIREIASRHFDRSAHADVYRRLYGELGINPGSDA